MNVARIQFHLEIYSLSNKNIRNHNIFIWQNGGNKQLNPATICCSCTPVWTTVNFIFLNKDRPSLNSFRNASVFQGGP